MLVFGLACVFLNQKQKRQNRATSCVTQIELLTLCQQFCSVTYLGAYMLRSTFVELKELKLSSEYCFALWMWCPTPTYAIGQGPNRSCWRCVTSFSLTPGGPNVPFTCQTGSPIHVRDSQQRKSCCFGCEGIFFLNVYFPLIEMCNVMLPTVITMSAVESSNENSRLEEYTIGAKRKMSLST